MGSSELVGKRSRGRADPDAVLSAADQVLSTLRGRQAQPAQDLRALKYRYAAECRAYYSVAALTRRRILDGNIREQALSKLFRVRSSLERAIIADLACRGLSYDTVRQWSSRSFFGVSAKQGVSVRYALASCIPTRRCGGGCYAHDGRDRELHHIFRGALNYFIGQTYGQLGVNDRDQLFAELADAISYGISAARREQAASRQIGFDRQPRIRFSHVGEMAATPEFTNDLAREIRRIDDEVACVIYSRHPSARLLDKSLLIVNFTLEGDADLRSAWVPENARVVASAWRGKLSSVAEINFLEHHVEKVERPLGLGAICPVTVDHEAKTSCDAARCQLCFVPTDSNRQSTALKSST